MSQHHGIKDETADKVFQAPHDSVFSRRDVPTDFGLFNFQDLRKPI